MIRHYLNDHLDLYFKKIEKKQMVGEGIERPKKGGIISPN
jgi:hypothetical protein